MTEGVHRLGMGWQQRGTRMVMRLLAGGAAKRRPVFSWGRIFGVARRFPTPKSSGNGTVRGLGLRDLGPWWGELYRVEGDPPVYLLQLTCPGARIGIRAAWLKIDGQTALPMRAGGRCLSVAVPDVAVSVSACREPRHLGVEIEGWDGAHWRASWSLPASTANELQERDAHV